VADQNFLICKHLFLLKVENPQAHFETVKRQLIEENHVLKSQLPDDAKDKPLGQEYEMLTDDITTLWNENLILKLQSIQHEGKNTHLEHNKPRPKQSLKEMMSKPQVYIFQLIKKAVFN
jgi:hypothetical protein